MAGNYDDVPGPRIAYDRDGTKVIGIDIDTAAFTEMNSSQIAAANNYASATAFNIHFASGTTSAGYLALLFPRTMDIVGYYFSWARNHNWIVKGEFAYSMDSTNGLDGSWTTVDDPFESADPNVANTVEAEWRTEIVESIFTAKAVRFRWKVTSVTTNDRFVQVRALHLYGAPSAGAEAGLTLWDPDNDEAITDGAYFDWAEVVRGEEYTKRFRVKNESGFDASGVALSTSIPTDASPSMATYVDYEIETDPGNWVSSLDLGDLAAGDISPVVTARYTPASNAQLGIRGWRTLVEATEWGEGVPPL